MQRRPGIIIRDDIFHQPPLILDRNDGTADLPLCGNVSSGLDRGDTCRIDPADIENLFFFFERRRWRLKIADQSFIGKAMPGHARVVNLAL